MGCPTRGLGKWRIRRNMEKLEKWAGRRPWGSGSVEFEEIWRNRSNRMTGSEHGPMFIKSLPLQTYPLCGHTELLCADKEQPLCVYTESLCGSISLKKLLENNFQGPMFTSAAPPPLPSQHKQPLCEQPEPLCGSISLKKLLENNFKSPMFTRRFIY